MPVTFTSDRFIGRERELARLAEALEGAAAGRTRTVLISGTGGIGISRLLDETARRVARLDDPFVVIRCPGRSGWRAEPYAPVVAGMAPALAALPDDELVRVLGPGIEACARLMPALAARLAALGAMPERPSIVAAERRQARVLEAIHGVLERIGERSPVLFALEDLQVADAATRALAVFLARISRPSRLCVVLTHQPDELTRDHPLRDDLAAIEDSAQLPDRIELGPLGRDDLADLIAAIAGERATASTLLLVAERSRGIPLAAEEIVAARRELSGVALSGSLSELVMARVARRSPECRRVLRLLAPAERPLTLVELVAVADEYERLAGGLPVRSTAAPRRRNGVLDADLAAGLAEAIEHGLVVRVEPTTAAHSTRGRIDRARSAIGARSSVDGRSPVDGGPAPDRDSAAPQTLPLPVKFRHPLLARAVTADLLPGQRRMHHVALASAFVEQPARSLRHWLAAFEPVAARKSALEAAALAESVDAPGDALAHLDLAIDLEPDGPPGAARRSAAQLRARAADAAFAAGQTRRAIAYVEAAIARLDERADRTELGLLHERLGRYRRVIGDPERALVAQRRAVALVPTAASPERALVLANLAQGLMLDGHFAESERVATEAISVARVVGPESRAVEAHAVCTLGIGHAWGPEPRQAVELLEQARAIATELGRPEDRFRAIANLTTSLELLGRRDEAIAVALDGIEEARRLGLETVYGNFLRGNVADVLFSAGRWDEARTMSRTALEWSPAGAAFVDAAWSLATVEIESRADDASARLLGRLLLELETVPDSQYVVPASRAAASFALWRGDPADAARAAEFGWSVVRTTEDWVLIARMATTMVEVQVARAEEARERRDLATVAASRQRAAGVVEEAAASVVAGGVPDTVASRREADAHLATARAYVARLEGRDQPAAWAALAARWEELGVPYQVARSRWRQAEAALPVGTALESRAAARAPLVEAARIADRLGARPLLREIKELARRSRIALPALFNADDGPTQRHEAAAGHSDPAVLVGAGGTGVVLARTPGNGAAALPGTPGVGVAASGASRSIEDHGRTGNEAAARSGSIVAALVDPRPVRRSNTFGLSGRERDVLGLIAEGRTNREIGERLFISQKTVGVHVGNILSKLGVSGRVEAATVAIRLGLTEPA